MIRSLITAAALSLCTAGAASAVTFSELNRGGTGAFDGGSSSATATVLSGFDTDIGFSLEGRLNAQPQDFFEFTMTEAFNLDASAARVNIDNNAASGNFSVVLVGPGGTSSANLGFPSATARLFSDMAAGTYLVSFATDTGNFVNYDVSVSAVPLPASAALLLTAVFGVGYVGRRRRQA